MDSQPRRSFRQWARGVREAVKNGVKKLIRSPLIPYASTAGPQPCRGNHGPDGPGDPCEPFKSATDTDNLQVPSGGPSSTTSQSATLQIQGANYNPLLEELSRAPPQFGHSHLVAAHISTPPASSSVKEVMKVSWNFTQTLLKRLPQIVDENPVKMALGLAKVIVEVKNAVKENMDAVEKRIASTGAQLEIMGDTRIGCWGPKDPERQWLERFKGTLVEELTKLRRLSEEWLLRKIADHEDEKSQIADILERVNEARMQFELYTNIRVLNAVNTMERTAMRTFANELKPSHMADHKYYLEGSQREVLRREVCTPGTRVRILGDAVTWANNTSPDSEDIFWLFGPVGSGKTTIAYTIARRFEATFDADDTITLGGNFLCSRQFEETRFKSCIIRTLAYQLARRCKGFADALNRMDSFDSIHQNVSTQLRELLITPWQQHLSACVDDSSSPGRFLFLIDAIDEIEQQGGSEFLRDLLTVIHDHHLPGLKFFVTSRSDPDIISRVHTFDRKQLVRLQDVEKEQVEKDVRTYLEAMLPYFRGREEMNLIQDLVGGLFVVAATIVRHLTWKRTNVLEQKVLLQKIFAREAQPALHTRSTHLLDVLYTQILSEAFSQLPEEFFVDKLSILHTFLCTTERTPASVVAKLLEDSDGPADPSPVLSCLHAVIYVNEHGNVLSYHKSFTDFMFDANRSGKFACDQPSQHRLLTQHCFRIMAGLRFNIANIPSSFVFDSDNPDLQDEICRNISPELSYSCRAWSRHLSLTQPFPPFLAPLSDFLQLRVLFRIEAMNLLGTATQCDPDLRRASEWVEKNPQHEENPVLPQQLRDTGSFALYFAASPASQSTPHLYISSLATWPRETGLAPTWRNRFHVIPDFRSRRLQHSVPLMTVNVGSRVLGVTVSADGQYIAAGCSDARVRLWDAQNGKQVGILKGHSGWVRSVALSSDGSRIVSGSDDKSIRLWNITTGEEERLFEGHTSDIYSVAFSNDDRRIVSGSADYSVRVWDTITGQEGVILQGHVGPVYSAAFSPDGALIVSGSDDKSVRLWDAGLGRQLTLLAGHTAAISSAMFSSDGAWIVSGSADRSVRIWDAATGNGLRVMQGHTSGVWSVVCSSDGRQVVSASGDATVRLWDATTGEGLKVLQGHTSDVASVAFSSGGGRVVSGSLDGSVRVWDAMAGEKQKKMLHCHKGYVYSATFSEDGSQIISGSEDCAVHVWDGTTGEQLNKLNGHMGRVRSVALSPDGTRVASGSDDKSVRVWDMTTGEEQLVLRGHTGGVWSAVFSSDGTHIVSGSTDCTVRVWDTARGKEQMVLKGHTDTVLSAAFSSDGAQIASGSQDRTVRIWDAAARKQLKVLEGPTETVLSVVFSPDESCKVVAGSKDGSIWIWNTRTGSVEHILRNHNVGTQSAMMLCSNGAQDRIVSGGVDSTVRVWGSAAREEQLVLEGHTDRVSSVALSRDGLRAVSASTDRTMRVWGLDGLPYTSEVIEGEATGWLLSSDDRQDYLMFAPPALIPRSPCVLVISDDPAIARSFSLTFSFDAIGEHWQKCFAPSS